MKEVFSIMVASVALVASTMAQGAVTMKDVDQMVEFLDQHHRRVPYRLATQLSTRNAPMLIEMLRSPEYERCRAQTVVLLGVIGDERAVRPLIDVLLHAYEGKVGHDGFAVLIATLNALADLAWSGSDEALDYLLAHRLPSDWARENPRWAYFTMSKSDLWRLLSIQTLMALGRTGKPEALAVLHTMSESLEQGEEIRSAAVGALDLHRMLQEKGRAAVLDPRFDPDEVIKYAVFVLKEVRAYLLDRRPDFLSQFLAENGQPVLVVEHGGTPDRDEYLLKRLAQEPGGIETQRQILLDIEAAEEVKRGAPVVTIADDGTAVVVIPLENSQPLVKRHFPQGVKGVTVDAEGRLVIHMIRSKDNRWYWNPFGW